MGFKDRYPCPIFPKEQNIKKSKARVGSPLFGKWLKIPPGFKNFTEAGDRAEIVDSPPNRLLEIQNIYCIHIIKS